MPKQSCQETFPTILIVDPSKTLRSIYAAHCEGRGASVEYAPDVPAALAAVGKCKPTAIITVDELEGLNGASLVAALKSSPEHRAIPIVLLTPNSLRPEDIGHYQPDHIAMQDGGMRESLERFLGSVGLGMRGVTDEDTEPTMLEGKRVLLAEDSLVNQTVVGRILHVAGVEVVVVDNGAQAVATALRESFDLILMDIVMPTLDGYEATRILRSSGLQIPILALTGEDAKNIDESRVRGGFDFVLHKPVERADLLRACNEHIRKAESKDEAA